MAEIQITTQDIKAGDKPVKIIGFAGQLDETNVDDEVKKIYQIIDTMDEPNMILDFANLTYMNSKSIGYVTDWYSRTAAKNGKVVIASPQANILDILKVVGITQIITIKDSTEDAKAEFGGGKAKAAPAPKPAEPEVKESAAVAVASEKPAEQPPAA